MEKPVLYTQQLCIGYHSKKETIVIASDVDIQLSSGKLATLIGANGVGKSTLLRTITGIQAGLSGKVILENREMRDFGPNELAEKLSVVLTEKIPPSNLSVYELIATARQPYTNWIGKLSREDRDSINEAMALTETGFLSEKKYYEISDGQLQKVLIARALAQDTPLIILDEPMTHLDFSHKASLFLLLRKLASQTGKAILFSTHDIDMAIQLSDEMIVMASGKSKQGKPQEFISDGTFDSLFTDENIRFDRQKQQFVFKHI